MTATANRKVTSRDITEVGRVPAKNRTRKPTAPTPAAATQAAEAATAKAEGKVQPNRAPKPTAPNTAKATADPQARTFDYAYVLESGSGAFSVHKPGCAAIKKVKTDYAQPVVGTAATYADMVRDLWSDQIAEHDAPEAEKATDEWVLGHYDTDISVHSCLRPAGKPKAAKPDVATARRDAKRALATRVVRAAAALNGLTDEEKRTIAHWLHHLPADRDEWVAAGLPKPDRSDWR